MPLSPTQNLGGIAAGFFAGALSAGIFHRPPCNRTSIPTLASRGVIGAGAFFLSIQIALFVADRIAPVKSTYSSKIDKDAALHRNGVVAIGTWAVSLPTLGVITKVAMNRLSWPITAKEIGANLLLSTIASLCAVAALDTSP